MGILSEHEAAGPARSGHSDTAMSIRPYQPAHGNGRRPASAAPIAHICGELAERPLERLREHGTEIQRLVAEHHARDPRIFDSVARGEHSGASDLDLLVDFDDDASLLDEIGLRLALSDLLLIEVDVVAADSLRGAMRERILREAVAL